jgi:cytochrome c oxidase assembly factor CtaG/ferredoxin
METISNAVFSSWEFNPWGLIPIFGFGVLYGRGWLQLHRRDPDRFGFFQLTAFFAGLTTVVCALCSPLDAFAGWLLTVHMIQHLLLMMVAPTLILWGAPYLPLLSGLPRYFAVNGVGPFLSSTVLRKVASFVSHPAFCWSAFISINVAWHLPAMYELALRSPSWHRVEHFSFLSTALLFWWPIIQPHPWVARTPRWLIVPYLFLADIQNTALSAFLIFCERVLYPTYRIVPRITSLTPLDDQAAAGAIMWVAGSIFFLVPAGLITMQLLSTQRKVASRNPSVRSQPFVSQRSRSASHGRSRTGTVDLLRVPLLGRILGWPHFRRFAQLITFLLAILVVVDGLLGPEMAPMNLAGVLPWTHWRGLTVFALLIVGNVFCFACPFNFARDLARRILPARWSWPRRLRSKWIAISLMLLFFWAYEAFSLWDSPRATAMLVIGYFAAAIVVDGLFTGASFCKYVCPIGQYQFVQSLISPVEVSVRNLAVCGTCQTYDCIRGNERQRGCELELFQPRKTSNMDCTLCLDCVHACPHENVSLLASMPVSQLVRIERSKKSRNKFFRRFDVGALIFLLVFAAFLNAGEMVLPVQSWEQSLETKLGLVSLQPIIAVLYLVTLVVLPAFLIAGCVWLVKTLGPIRAGWREIVWTFAPAFVPLGFSMWLIHFSYHLLTAGQTALPISQRAAIDVGITIFGRPDWSLSSTMPSLEWLPSLELVLLDLGLLFTLFVGWRIASRFRLSFVRTLKVTAPWAALAFVLYSVGIWIIFQPMQMRGMMMMHSMH